MNEKLIGKPAMDNSAWLFWLALLILLCSCSSGPDSFPIFDPTKAANPTRMGDTLHLPLNFTLGIKASNDIVFLQFTNILPDRAGVEYSAVHISMLGGSSMSVSTNGVIRWSVDKDDLPGTDGSEYSLAV